MTSTPTNTGLKLQGVLFDMDGTLLDSEKLWDVALEDLATALGGDLSPRARRRMVGSSLARSIAIMHDDLGIDADPQSSGAYLTERAAELFRTALVWKPGARAAAARGSRCRCASRPRDLDESPAHRDRPGHSRARVVRGQCVRRRGPPSQATSGALSHRRSADRRHPGSVRRDRGLAARDRCRRGGRMRRARGTQRGGDRAGAQP